MSDKNGKPYDLKKNGIKVRVDEKGNKFEDWPQLPHNLREEIEQYLETAGWSAYAGDAIPDIRVLINNAWQNIRLPNEMADNIVFAYRAIGEAKQAEEDLQKRIDEAVKAATKPLHAEIRRLEEELAKQQAAANVAALAKAGDDFEDLPEEPEEGPGSLVQPLEPVSVEPSGHTTHNARRRIVMPADNGYDPNSVKNSTQERPAVELDPDEEDFDEIHREEGARELPTWFYVVAIAVPFVVFFIFRAVVEASFVLAVIMAALEAFPGWFYYWDNRKEEGSKSDSDRPFVARMGQLLRKISERLDPSE